LQTTKAGQTLLHINDLLDVLNIVAQRIELCEHRRMLLGQIFGQLGEIAVELLPFWITREVVTQSRGVLLQHDGNPTEVADRGFTDGSDKQT